VLLLTETRRRTSATAGHARELVSAAILELESRSDHQVAQRARYEHIVRPCQSAHPRADVHGDPADVIAPDFALAGVQTGTYFDTDTSSNSSPEPSVAGPRDNQVQRCELVDRGKGFAGRG
jgi:hypothetical protein